MKFDTLAFISKIVINLYQNLNWISVITNAQIINIDFIFSNYDKQNEAN